ncbi:hypothetical protein SGFS_054250 [Streptomyces graminofaciens]|uniref:DUF1980 domain-containing protein n=1 Tax=Streptomyces graminofaciens TaxID=68212 RepID=A0ABM7FCG6_9ACTN|nr:TIGR03943 family protein [Streptomyces graminofaciens]BBC34131.1 hypothetical protein SGFS_054250 [Streptomyces graminofaciens]
MKRPVQAVLLLLSGLGVLHASLFTDLCLRYVKEGMRPLLVVSGVLLVLLGLAEAWSLRRRTATTEAPDDHGDGHAHDHSATPRISWLLLLPALSLLFFAPPALGAYTAAREAPKAVVAQDDFEPLPKTTKPLPMTLTDFTSRVQQDKKRAIKGRSVQLSGYVTPRKDGDGWELTRTIFSCCAADAQFVKVRMYGASAPAADTWVSVTGTWHPGGTLGTGSAPAALDARTVKKIAKPVNAYKDELPWTPSR